MSLSLNAYSHVLVSASPDADGDPVLRTLTQAFIQAGHLEWIGYLSTTGVYGDHNGKWVDEKTPVSPTTQRGKWRVDAENSWLDLSFTYNLPVHIFRLAGIYGPERGPFEKIINNTSQCIIKENQVFSRIHVEDIATVLQASFDSIQPGRIYNVCDDVPAPPQDVLQYAAMLLGYPPLPEVPFEEAIMSPMARSFYNDSKKVSNERIKTELGVHLTYPDYQTGLKSLLPHYI